MAKVLDEAGIKYTMPAGTFYFFPKAPEGVSDVEFVDALAQERVLVVPGSGFGFPGYFRIALCVDEKFIDLSLDGFKRATAKAKNA
jgi:aspartate aminotransferase